VAFTGTGTAIDIGTSQTTGALALGGPAQTGTITVGQSTDTQITNIQTGATATAKTKTINVGTGGLAGSTTTIAIGPVAATTAAATATFGSATTVAIANTSGTALSVTGNITGGNIAATAHTGTSVSVTGSITGASLTVSTGNVTLGNIVNAGANLTGNIGSATLYFNTVFAKATSAQYADLAEWYEADADYLPGTVLVFGGDKEVTQAIGINDVRVAGVVSTNPAHIMNSGLKAEHTAALALTGRVPTLVVGAVKKGDMMVTAGGGRAQACAEPRMGSVIGKALQDHAGGQGTIEIVVGRM
jgi:hypothetical protein